MRQVLAKRLRKLARALTPLGGDTRKTYRVLKKILKRDRRWL